MDKAIENNFKTARLDGRSDRQVILDLCSEAEPETLFSYKALGDELQQGVDVPVVRQRIQQAVGVANKQLLREHSRALRVVANVGYRVVRADEHLPLALDRKRRAADYLNRGRALLQHVRIDELTPTQRKLHEGQLLVLSALIENMRDSEKRHRKQEKVLDDLRQRVERLEVEKKA